MSQDWSNDEWYQGCYTMSRDDPSKDGKGIRLLVTPNQTGCQARTGAELCAPVAPERADKGIQVEEDKEEEEEDLDEQLIRLHRIRNGQGRKVKHFGCKDGCCTLTKEKPKQQNKDGKESKTSKGIMAVGSKNNKDEYEDFAVDAVMDSGACDTITSLDIIGDNEVRETKSSKQGMNYYGPDGSPIKNWGESDVKGVSEDGIPLNFTAQIGDSVKRMLISIHNVTKSGNMVIFGADMKAIRDLARLDSIDDNVIVGIKSGVRSKIQDRNGMYVYPIKIKRRKKDSMEVDVVQKSKEEDDTSDEEPSFP
jgi:hypothetical protein